MNTTLANVSLPASSNRRLSSLAESWCPAGTSRKANSSIENARPRDIGSLIQLIGASVPHVAPSTVWEIPWTWSYYQVLRDSTNCIIAAGALVPLGIRCAEIRGLAVSESSRGSGIATAIVEHLLSRAERSGLETVCVTRRPDFFRKLGFEETSPTWLHLQHSAARDLRSLGPIAYQSLHPRVAMAAAG